MIVHDITRIVYDNNVQELIAFSILLLLVISTLFEGNYAFLPLSLFTIFVLAIVVRELRERSRTSFINQLKSARMQLRAGQTIIIGSALYTYSTLLTTYKITVGSLILNIEIPSQYKSIYDVDQHQLVTYSLGSLFAGWWSFSGGPLVTIATVVKNLRGGEIQSVAELIDGPIIKRYWEEEKKRSIKQTKVQKHDRTSNSPELDHRIRSIGQEVPPGLIFWEKAQKKMEAYKERIIPTEESHPSKLPEQLLIAEKLKRQAILEKKQPLESSLKQL
jgi:hypothetical protein